MKGKIFFVFICLMFSVSSANSENISMQVVEKFHSFCYVTNADFAQISKIIKKLPLEMIDNDYLSILSGHDAKNGKLYLVEKLDDKKFILLGFGQPNSCSINVQGIDFLPIKKIMIEQFKLAHGYTDDVGLQINELYVPGGVTGNKKEAGELGAIMLMYPKPLTGYLGGTIAYLPPERARVVFNLNK